MVHMLQYLMAHPEKGLLGGHALFDPVGTLAEVDEEGLMAERHASINDVAIEESERKFRWDSSGPRPADHPGLTELGL